MQTITMTRLVPVRQLLINIVLYAGVFALAARWCPWILWLPIAVVIVSIHCYWVERKRFARYRDMLQGVKATQVEGFPVLKWLPDRPVEDVMMDNVKELTTELEKKCYQLVEKNIQLLSLKEISLTIISSLDEARIVDSVHSFLSKGLGFKELFVCIYGDDIDAFRMYTLRDLQGESSSREAIVRLEQIDGLVKKSIMARKPVLIRDPDMHPIGTLEGQPMFENSTMESYLVVPMVKSKYSQRCWQVDTCVLKTHRDPNDEPRCLDDALCPGCGRLPVLGAIGVTDGFKAGSLSQVDLVSVETLALQISTLLENSALYNELKSERSFRDNVIDSMMNGLITVDIEGRVLLANETAENLSGYTDDELKGVPIEELIIETSVESPVSPVRRALQSGQSTYQQEAWLVKKDGEKLPIQLHVSYLFDENRELRGALAVFLDITRIKNMEQKITHLDKLAALGRFSSSMAHEIRNPLTGIVAGLEYLRRVGGIPSTHDENIQFILSEVNRIDRLITDILGVVRGGELVYQPVEIESLIRGSILALRDAMEKRDVTCRTIFPEETRTVMIDSDRITQVMINLLKNAVEASDTGQEIRIKVSYPVNNDDLIFEEIRDLVVIEVADDGRGFREEDKSQIFEPFFTTKTEGTGLGLYVTHSIIERHGGYIFVESEEKKGTVFTVYLPVEKVEHGHSNQVSHTAS